MRINECPGLGHRLGYPPVASAVDAILNPPPAWLNWPRYPFNAPVVAAQTPEEAAAAKKEDAEAMAKGRAVTPDPKAAKRDPPYCPEGWGGFVYHNAKGEDSEPILPKLAHRITEWTPIGVQMSVDEAIAVLLKHSPNEWQSGPPPCVGWYETYRASIDAAIDAVSRAPEKRWRYWDGAAWGCYVREHDRLAERTRCLNTRTASESTGPVAWRGPRLTGADWPEPEAA